MAPSRETEAEALERRKVEALEKIAEALECIRDDIDSAKPDGPKGKQGKQSKAVVVDLGDDD